MLDQFDTSAQMAGDCDREKISTPDNAKIASFESFVPGQGQLKAARAKIYKISGKYCKMTCF